VLMFSDPANWSDMTGLETDTAFMQEFVRWAKKAPSAIAKEAGVAATTILRPYNGTAETRISQPTYDKLRSKFPDFPGWKREEPDQLGHHGERRDPSVTAGEIVYVPEVDISFAMGDGAVIEDYPAETLIPFNLSFLRGVAKSTTDKLFISTGHGESMEPTLLRSDMLMIDTSQRVISGSDFIWAINYAGGGMVKRVRLIREDGRNRYLILSDNPVVPPLTADPEDVHVVGKLVWVGRRMGGFF